MSEIMLEVVPHVHGHKRLEDDDATENVKPHLQLHVFVASSHLRLHGNMSLYVVEAVKTCNCLLFSGSNI